jgi:hypothetical protein
MDDVFEITASTLTILACGFELLRLTRGSPAAGEAPRGEDRASDAERFLQIVLGLGAVCLGLAAAAFLFARSEVLIGAGILTIFFTASLPDPAFSGCC